MKPFGRLMLLFPLTVASIAWGWDPNYPQEPGNVFIREKIVNLKDFKGAFQSQRDDLKKHGFSAYSLHRDLQEPPFIILTLKCSNLRKGVDFILSKGFQDAMTHAGVENPVLWAGIDIMERHYSDRPKITDGSGIVIANNQVKSYVFWKKCWDAEGKHHHPGRGYTASHYSISRLKAKPETVIVAHEASDITKAPAFMTAPAMKGVMESVGVIGLNIWYGVSLEEGIF